ncbi:MAG: hypothetical protein AMDU5_GPLC00001G0131 [Thermoplasmatales archaeon Gpl]|jgi:hypothetical protein|nr:MAG: hypothetical protein AMDU5_GPLC00001G0131 [Thermoplasmatales archaeon Gpl]
MNYDFLIPLFLILLLFLFVWGVDGMYYRKKKRRYTQGKARKKRERTQTYTIEMPDVIIKKKR